MPDLALPTRSLERLARSIQAKSADAQPWIVSRAEGEEMARNILRYCAQDRQMKNLSIDDIEPVQEMQGLPEDIGATKAALTRQGSVGAGDRPFLSATSAGASQSQGLGGVGQVLSVAQQMKLSGTSSDDGQANAASINFAGSAESPIPCINLKSIPDCPQDINLTEELLNKVAILRLNGGLGTSMGARGPKSAIEVRDGQSFLDMAVRQVEFLNTKYGVDVPLILMNSFNTDLETKRVLSRYDERHVNIMTFMQSRFPRIAKSSLATIATAPCPLSPSYKSKENELWFPPGHGDVYTSLARSGLLAQLISLGKEYIFISNIDNLGATIDLNLLYHIMDNDYEFFMEVTKKERQDTTGGLLVVREGKPLLLETQALPRVTRDTLDRDPRFNKFNTNNLWVNLRALQSLIATKQSLELPVLVRERSQVVDGEELATLAFKTAAGSAVALFEKVCAVVVPRNRFFPVKTTDDLFAVQSGLFTVKHGSLRMSVQSESRKVDQPVPTVKLGPNFRTVEEYNKRLPFGVPDIIELEHLTVSGDVRFRNHVVLKGTVILVADEGKHIDISSGSVLRDKVITGHLNILPH